jgi:prepilin-type N-terminal cleavage/methylation domain-containing protein/prepilin-type processing-associated H-X9-DG protein
MSGRQRGFTFVEFQVVIVVVAVLIALLLPAVQTAREAARKSQCQDHLFNHAIGLHNYESAYKTFPPGWVHQAKRYTNAGWGTSLLPFMEQLTTYDLLERGRLTLPQSLAMPQVHAALQTPISYYRCPTDPATELNRENVPTDAEGEPREVALSNYVGSNGGGGWSRGRELTGFFGENSRVGFADILDGTSNTIMVGERSLELGEGPNLLTCGAAIPYGVGGNGSGSIEHFTLFIGDGGLNSRLVNDKGNIPHCTEGMSSWHPGGVMVSFGDGRVSLLADETDPENLKNLLDRADGNVVQLP